MSIHVGRDKAVLCRGNYRPAALYKGNEFIGGAVRSEPVAVPGSIEGAYNDTVEIAALGKGRQDGIPAPENPVPLIHAEAAVSTQGSTIQLPILRGIPDGNGGWAARDQLVPVAHQPGWYDLRLEVSEKVIDSTLDWSTYEWKGVKSVRYYDPSMIVEEGASICTHFRNLYRAWIGQYDFPCYSDHDRGKHKYFVLSTKYPEIDINVVLEEWKRFIDEQKSDGNPVKIWYKLERSTTERIYLGPLKSYPHLTTLTMEGNYPPEVTATAMVAK